MGVSKSPLPRQWYLRGVEVDGGVQGEGKGRNFGQRHSLGTA